MGNKKIFIGLVFLVIIGAGVYLLQSNNTPNSPINELTQNIKPKPSPFPFEELTIPYLLEREYKSQIAGLSEKYSENTNYTTFLTSYESDGFKVNGLLTIPKGDMPQGGWPAIIFVHGYIPPAIYQTTGSQYSDYVDYLATSGFAVFKIDLRGNGNSEGEAGGAYYSSDYITDVLNAHAALGTLGEVNEQRVGLWGHSMAGNVIMRSLAAKPDIPAIVMWAGAVYTYKDFAEYGIDDNSYQAPPSTSQRVSRRQELFDNYGQPADGNPFWDKVAPTNYLSDIKGAIQIHHAQNDNVVDIRYSQNLNKILNETSVEHEFFEYSTGGHNLEGPTFNTAMQRTVEFFKNNL